MRIVCAHAHTHTQMGYFVVFSTFYRYCSCNKEYMYTVYTDHNTDLTTKTVTAVTVIQIRKVLKRVYQ
jgi:hypothetical protein